jgi:acyl-CoA reductase-like NAD-dependent aldehyde dehydrogenase
MASNSEVNGNGIPQPSTSFIAPLWLDGKEVTTSGTFDVSSPVTNKVIYKASAASKEDVDAAVASAEKALKSWSKTKPATRSAIFLRAADELEARKEQCFKYMREETGSERMMFDLTFEMMMGGIRDIAGLVSSINGSVPTIAEEGRSAMVLKEPYGVCLAIAPW